VLTLAASGHPGPVNIGNPTELSVRQIAEDMLAATGSGVPDRARRAAG